MNRRNLIKPAVASAIGVSDFAFASRSQEITPEPVKKPHHFDSLKLDVPFVYSNNSIVKQGADTLSEQMIRNLKGLEQEKGLRLVNFLYVVKDVSGERYFGKNPGIYPNGTLSMGWKARMESPDGKVTQYGNWIIASE